MQIPVARSQGRAPRAVAYAHVKRQTDELGRTVCVPCRRQIVHVM